MLSELYRILMKLPPLQESVKHPKRRKVKATKKAIKQSSSTYNFTITSSNLSAISSLNISCTSLTSADLRVRFRFNMAIKIGVNKYLLCDDRISPFLPKQADQAANSDTRPPKIREPVKMHSINLYESILPPSLFSQLPRRYKI